MKCCSQVCACMQLFGPCVVKIIISNQYINIKLVMNKEHLAKLQEKVNRLMRNSSQDSDSQNIKDLKLIMKETTQKKDSQPETVRKCIDLIKQNKQLKLLLQKQRSKTDKLRKQIQKSRRQQKQEKQEKQINKKWQPKLAEISEQQLRKLGRFEAELQEQRKKSKILEQLLMKQRKKNRNLSMFINKNIPEMEQNLDKLTATIDAKLQAYFLAHPTF